MKKRLLKLTMLLGLVFVFLASTAPRFFAEDESKQYTFYNTASDVAQVMEEFTATGKDTMSKVAKVTTNGEVGNFLGVRDKDRSKGSIAFTSVEITKANSSIAYDQLGIKANSETPTFKNTGLDFSGYILYGEALKSAGLDSMDGDLIAKPFRMVQGVFLWSGLTAIRAIDGMWSFVGQVLNFINPFRLFTRAIESVNNLQDFTGLGEESWMVSIGKTLAEFYTALTQLAFNVTVPVLIVLAVAWLILSSKAFRAFKWLRTAIATLVFITLVFPLLGSIYTSAIGYISDMKTSSENVDQNVNSILFDFERNVTTNKMSTNGISLVYDREAGGLTGTTVKNLRTMVLASNNASSEEEARKIAGSKTDSVIDVTKGDKGLEDMKNNYTDAKANAKTDLVMERVIKFMSNKAYLASEYESMMKTNETVDSLFGPELKEKSKATKFVESGYEGKDGKPKLLKAPNADGVKVEHNGKLTTVTVEPDGFSPLSIYNYLSSEFNGRSITMTSATNTSSLIARSNHYAVNLVGGGLLSFLYWLQTVFLMFTVSVVGIMYISGIIKDSVASAFSIIGNMFKVSVGVVNGIARIVGAFVLMLLSVFGTVFFYQIFKEILFAIPVALSKMLALAPSADNAIVVSSYEGLACVLTCFICFFIGQVALKNRKEFIHGFDKTIEAIVHQIVGTNPGQGTKLNPDTPRLRDVAGQTMAGANALGNGIFGKKNEDGVREGGALRTATDWGNSMAEKARNSSAGQYLGEMGSNAMGEIKGGLGKAGSAVGTFASEKVDDLKDWASGTAPGLALHKFRQKRETKRIVNSGGNEKPKSSYMSSAEKEKGKTAQALKEAPLATMGAGLASLGNKVKGGVAQGVTKAKDYSYAVKNFDNYREGLAKTNAQREENGVDLLDTSYSATMSGLLSTASKKREQAKVDRQVREIEAEEERLANQKPAGPSKKEERHKERARKRKEIEYEALWEAQEKHANKQQKRADKARNRALNQMNRRGHGRR